MLSVKKYPLQQFRLLCGLLASLCIADGVSTAIWVSRGEAVEANPLLSWTFAYPLPVFLVVKTLSFVPALWLGGRLFRAYPTLTLTLLWLVLISYVLCYGGAQYVHCHYR
jgi:hypothetical protein